MLTKIDLPGLYKDDTGLLYLVDYFGVACKLDLMMANQIGQRYINALAALAGQSY